MNFQEGSFHLEQLSGNCVVDSKFSKGSISFPDISTSYQLNAEGGSILLMARNWEELNYSFELSKVVLSGEELLHKSGTRFRNINHNNKIHINVNLQNSNLKLQAHEY